MQENVDNISSFFERISKIMDFYHIKSVSSFALDHLGYSSPEKINRLKKKGNNPSFEILSDISNKFDKIDVGWLLTGKGEMIKKNSISHNIEYKEQSNLELINSLINRIEDLSRQVGEKTRENEQLLRENAQFKSNMKDIPSDDKLTKRDRESLYHSRGINQFYNNPDNAAEPEP